MRLKSMRGLLAHNFDINYIHKLIEDDSLERDDAVAILNNAVNVISELRGIVNNLSADTNIMKERSDWAMKNDAMKGRK
jgi:hypothetical protein